MTKYIHDLEVDQTLFDAVFVDPDQLKEEYARVGADLAYWNTKYSNAFQSFIQLKHEAKKLRARTWLQTREQLKADGEKATEALIDAFVENDLAVIEADLRTIEAEAEKTRLFGILDGIRAKRDMLVGLGALVRSEMEHSPVLRNERRFKTMQSQGLPDDD